MSHAKNCHNWPSKFKGHREGKNIPPGQIPLYRDVPGHHLERWEQGPDYANEMETITEFCLNFRISLKFQNFA